MGRRVKASHSLLWLLLAAAPSTAWAVTTMAFDLEGVSTFEEGHFAGTAVQSDGRLVRAPKPEPVELEATSVAYCSVVDAEGRVFVGTGNEGKVFLVEGDAAKVHAALDVAVVTSLAAGPDGLFAGAMPGGKVFRIASSGEVSTLVELPGVEHIWALAYDAASKRLYAGTGPEGHLYAIDAQGKAQLLLDAEAEHILSVALGKGGAVYAGTSDGALLYRVDKGRTEVVYDFPGDELGALSVREGRIAVAANDFPTLPKAPKNGKSNSKPPKLKPGSGEIWVVHPDGRAEALHEVDESHVSAVELTKDGAVYAAATKLGRVLRVEPNGEHGVWAEIEGRDVMALGLTTASPHVVASDSAALVRMAQGNALGTWTSKPLDAETRARWGELTPRFSGDVRWQTRSGNTEEPDATWSSWSRPSKARGPVRSPAARYLQVRAQLAGDDAELRAVEALYLPSNRPARSRHVHVDPPKKPKEEDFVDGVYRVPSELELEWDTDNPDGDPLSFTLHVARDGANTYLPLLKPGEQLSKPKFKWETRHFPDGLYRVRVTTSDAPGNPESYALESSVVSPLIRVDNHAPRLRLTRKGNGLTGAAEDDTSRIAALTVSVDGGPFLPLSPRDDLLDQRREIFSHEPTLAPGTHIVAVRATDAAGNARIEQLTLDVR